MKMPSIERDQGIIKQKRSLSRLIISSYNYVSLLAEKEAVSSQVYVVAIGTEVVIYWGTVAANSNKTAIQLRSEAQIL